jgi:hypothetical protein
MENRSVCQMNKCYNRVEGDQQYCLVHLAETSAGDYYRTRLEVFREQDKQEHPRVWECPKCGHTQNNLQLTLHACEKCGY